MTITHRNDQRSSLKFVFTKDSSLPLKQVLCQLVITNCSCVHQGSHTIKTLPSVDFNFPLTIVQEGLDRLDIAILTGVSERSLVLFVSVLPGDDIVLQYDADIISSTINGGKMQWRFLLSIQVEHIRTFLE